MHVRTVPLSLKPAQLHRLKLLEANAKDATEKLASYKAKLKAVCDHPSTRCNAWTITVYQVGVVHLGWQCDVCRRYNVDIQPNLGKGITGRWFSSVKDATDEVIATCKHPDNVCTDYKWHHGYGKYVTGSQCGVCHAKQSFKAMDKWTPKSDWENWRRVGDDD